MSDEKELLEKVNKEATEAVLKFKEEYREIATKAAEGKMTKDEVDLALKGFETRVNQLTDDRISQLKGELDKVTLEQKAAVLEIAKLKDGNGQPIVVSQDGFGTILRKSLEKEGLIEEQVIDSLNGKKAIMLKGYDKNDTRVSVKSAIDMTTALAVQPGATPGTAIGSITDYKMRDVMIDLTKDTHVMQFLPTDPIVDKYMGVLVEYDYFDGSALKTEGSASAKSSIEFKTIEFKVFTFATHFRVSKENLADIPRLESKLNRIAPDKIKTTFDTAVLAATGDNSATVKGMYVSGNYTPFVAADFAQTVESANIIDLIRKMKLQAHNADQDVNVVILHPSQIDEIEGLKDLMHNYLEARSVVYDANGKLVRIHGLSVVVNKIPTTNKVTVMWNEAAEIGLREDINFEIGLNGSDLTEGMRTIVFEMRAAFGVSKPAAIIVSTDPATDINTISKAV